MARIEKRKNKSGEIVSFRIRVYRGYGNNGEKLKTYEKTYKPEPGMTAKQIEKEVNRQAVEFENQCNNGLVSGDPKLTLQGFIPQYLEIVRDRLSPTTYEFYNHVIDNLIIPALGHLKMKSIKPVHVQAFVQQISNMTANNHANNADQDNKLSANTVKRYLCVLQSIFKQAVKLDIIAVNPAAAERLTLQKVVAPKIEIFTKQEAAQMLSYLEEEELQFQVLIQLAIMTGARRGELTALKFSDIDYVTNKITIERAAIKLKGKPVTTKPPKDYEVRTVAVNEHCINLIKMLKEEKEGKQISLGNQWHDEDWLFTQWNGKIMHPQTPTKQFSKFLIKNNLNHRKFHSLRHTSATLLLYGGVNIKQVQERLGHGDIETTNKYLHYLSEADEEAANVLQDMLITKSGNKEIKHA